MASRIEQIIEEIEEYIDGCKPQTFSSSKIIVNREEMEELLNELRIKTPEEIKRYQKIISNKEAILADAQAKADAIIAQAQVKTDELVSEHQIMQPSRHRRFSIMQRMTPTISVWVPCSIRMTFCGIWRTRSHIPWMRRRRAMMLM